MLLIMASSLFVQTKAQDYQTTLDNLQTILNNVEAIEIPIKNALQTIVKSRDALQTRKDFQIIEKYLKQLPQNIQPNIKYLVTNFKKRNN